MSSGRQTLTTYPLRERLNRVRFTVQLLSSSKHSVAEECDTPLVKALGIFKWKKFTTHHTWRILLHRLYYISKPFFVQASYVTLPNFYIRFFNLLRHTRGTSSSLRYFVTGAHYLGRVCCDAISLVTDNILDALEYIFFNSTEIYFICAAEISRKVDYTLPLPSRTTRLIVYMAHNRLYGTSWSLICSVTVNCTLV